MRKDEFTKQGEIYESEDALILVSNGYRAEDKNLSDEERHRILEHIVDDNIMSLNQLTNSLDFLINQNSAYRDLFKAVRNWREDKFYIIDYKSSQRKEN